MVLINIIIVIGVIMIALNMVLSIITPANSKMIDDDVDSYANYDNNEDRINPADSVYDLGVFAENDPNYCSYIGKIDGIDD